MMEHRTECHYSQATQPLPKQGKRKVKNMRELDSPRRTTWLRMDVLCFVILAPSEHLFNYAHSLISGDTMLFVLVSADDEMATA